MFVVCWMPSLGNCALAKQSQLLRTRMRAFNRGHAWKHVENRVHETPLNICSYTPVVLWPLSLLVSQMLSNFLLHVSTWRCWRHIFFPIFRLGWNLNVLPHLPGSVLKHVGFVQGKTKLQAGKLQRFLTTGRVCFFEKKRSQFVSKIAKLF